MADAPIARLGLDLDERITVGRPIDSPAGVGGIIIARSPWWAADNTEGDQPEDRITILSVHPERNATTYLVADYQGLAGRLVRDVESVQRFPNIVPAAVYYHQVGGGWSGDCGHGHHHRPVVGGCVDCDPDMGDLAARLG